MRPTRNLLLIFISVLIAVLSPVAALGESVQAAPLTRASEDRNGMVRVYLSSMGTLTAMDITVDGSYTADGEQNVTLTRGDKVSVSFQSATGQITVTMNGVSYAMGREVAFRRHAVDGNNGLRIAQSKKPGNLYPGDLHLTAVSASGGYKLYPILHVYLEAYLTGVVPYEMGNSANLEALKAQAVAARTYTLGRMNTRSGALYDVVDTTNDQVYYGNSTSTANCTNAVNSTKGIVLMNGAALTATYYTASNGGQTEAAENVWGSSAYGYLTIREDPFDKMNPAAPVKSTVIYRDNTNALQHSGLKALLQKKAEAAKGQGQNGAVEVRSIDRITPHTPKFASPSRLYTKLDFDVTAWVSGSEVQLTLTCDIFSELESLLGMSINTARNELWSVEEQGTSFLLAARRYGHGAGMSQRGAMQMGELGYTYDQILGFYYPGCRRVQYTFTHTILGGVADAPDQTITTTETGAAISPGSCIGTVKLFASGEQLAIRDKPSASGSVLTGVVNGGVVTVLKAEGEWMLVQLGQVVGYVPSSALTISGELPAAPSDAPASVPGTQVTQVSQWATVDCTGTLNLRSEPSYTGTVKTTIPAGTVLCVFEVTDAWAHVQYGAVTGYVAKEFLQFSSTYPQKVVSSAQTQAVVTVPGGTGTVRLRASASTGAKILAQIAHGTVVTVTGGDGSWSTVQVNGQVGYMMTAYLSRVEETVPESEPPFDNNSVPDEPQSLVTEAVVHTVQGNLALRQGPGTDTMVLTWLPRGSSVAVVERGETWTAVRYGSLTGYAMTAYLTFPESGESQQPVAYAAVVTPGGSLNLRNQPQAGSSILTTVPQGAQLGILTFAGEWTRVTWQDKTGYVMTQYLAMEDDETIPVAPNNETQAADWAIVTTVSGSLNLRSMPSKSAKVIAAIPKGTRLPILSREGAWCQTVYAGKSGYVMAEFLTMEAVRMTPEPERNDLPAQTDPPAADPPMLTTAPVPVPTEVTPAEQTEAPEPTPEPQQAPGSLPAPEEGQTAPDVPWEDDEHHDFFPEEETAPPTPSPKPAPHPVYDPTLASDGLDWQARVQVSSGTLNVRAWCSTNAPILMTLENGQTVSATAIGREWSEIEAEGMEGYCMTKYLTLYLP